MGSAALVYRVFRLPAAHASKVDLLLQDDLVGRQSVITRDATGLGLRGDDRYVVVEGTDAGVARAAELLKETAPALKGSEAEDVYRRIRAQDDAAASAMGMIFGP